MFKKLALTLTALAVAALAADSPSAYVVAVAGDGSSQFGKLGLADGSFFLIRNYEPTFWGVTRSGDSFYAVDGEGTLYKIDPESGAPTTIGATGVPTSGPIDVSFVAAGGLSSGEFYGVDSSSNLWSIDLKTGHAKMVGNTGLTAITTPFFGTSLAGDDKYLYQMLEIDFDYPVPAPASKIQEPALYRIDPATAKATKIGKVPSFIGGSALVNGKLYGFSTVLNEDPDVAPMDGPTYEINLQTGEAHALAVPAPCMGFGFGGFPAPAAKPAVATSAGQPGKTRAQGAIKAGRACSRCASPR